MTLEEYKQKLFEQRPGVKKIYDRLIQKDSSEFNEDEFLDEIQRHSLIKGETNNEKTNNV